MPYSPFKETKVSACALEKFAPLLAQLSLPNVKLQVLVLYKVSGM